jgi:hypothetical protein
MAKEATQKLKYPVAKKHSVQFRQAESEKTPLFSSVYLMREGAKKLLGIKNLDEITKIEITIRIVE